MRALVTASFDSQSLRRLERYMRVVHDIWKRDRKIYFDGEDNAPMVSHVSGATIDVVRHQNEVIVRSIEQYLGRRRPPDIWKPEVLDGGTRPARAS